MGKKTRPKPEVLIEDGGIVVHGPPSTSTVTDIATKVVAQLTEEAAPKVEPLTADIVPLSEASVRDDGTVAIKVVQPGWGNSGHYSAEVLERDGPKAFPVGTPMFWNHPSLSEAQDRPERDLRDLAATTVSDAYWQESGNAGPGLYADAKVFGDYSAAVDELAPHIGVSLRARGEATHGEAEGRTGPIVERISEGLSIDFITSAGAGGQVVEMFEAARPGGVPKSPKKEQSMAEINEAPKPDNSDELAEVRKALDESKREIGQLREAQMLSLAREVVTVRLADAQIPAQLTRDRILTECVNAAKAGDDGMLDVTALDESVDKAVEAATAELAQFAEASGAGMPSGVGLSEAAGEYKSPSDEDQAREFAGFGLSEAEARQAVIGR